MSIYHTTADVQVKLKGMVNNANSIISDIELQKMCERTEAVVTERFARKFIVPFDSVKNPNAYLIAQKICIALTANDALNIIKLSSIEPINPDAKVMVSNLYGEASSLLKQLDENRLQMSDATRISDIKKSVDSSGSLTGTDFASGINQLPELRPFTSPPTPLSGQPVFNRRRRQW